MRWQTSMQEVPEAGHLREPEGGQRCCMGLTGLLRGLLNGLGDLRGLIPDLGCVHDV
jgi:hypothetical protein